MGRRPLVAMVAGWFAVVLAVAAITFVVVDRAGRGVGRASAAQTVAVVSTTVPQGSASRTPTEPPTPSQTPEPSESADSSEAPEPTPTVRRTTPEPESTPTPREPESRTASFTTDGGIVVASCQGSQISLGSIRPRDGWRFEKESEDGGLEVVFKTSEREVEIHVSCQAGVPTRAET